MKLKSKHIIFTLTFILLMGCEKENAIECDSCFAVLNTNIINVENGRVDAHMSLIIQDNYITDIGKKEELNIPSKAIKIDGKDKFVIPGLWDMHAHFSSDSIARQVAFPLLIANGVTGIRNMKSDCYDEEYPCEKYNEATIEISKKWRKDISCGSLLGPRMVLGSQMVNGIRGDSSTILSPGTIEHGREHVKFLKKRGIDFVKIYEELPRDVFFAVADEAKRQKMVLAGHVPFEVKTSEAIKAGQHSIEHCCDDNIMLECSKIEDELRQKWQDAIVNETFNLGKLILELETTYDALKCENLFDLYKEFETWSVPTLIVSESHYPYLYDWTNDDRLKYLPKSERLLWQEWVKDYYFVYGEWDLEKQLRMRKRRFEIVSSMNKKGIQILAGTDCAAIGVFWGSSIHEELELLVEAGLSEFEALKTATLNPAIFLESTDSLGTIQKGKIADLVILGQNPLLDISNTRKINGVITNGNYYNKIAIDSLLMNVEIKVRTKFN